MPTAPTVAPAARTEAAGPTIVTRVLNLLSSVRFGVVLLVLLVVASMIGMIIMQVNVEGFDKYYAELTPASRYLLGKLGFFDIYHVWYFNALLLVLSLNIVLASIDRFPSAWSYVSKKKLDASARWLKGQEQSAALVFAGEGRAAVVERVAGAFRAARLKAVVTEKGAKTFVFGERGAWNRLGAYAVHVSLLTIFFGGFLTAQFGRVGNMPLEPGKSADTMTETIFDLDRPARATYELPFTVECLDVQQKLIRKEGTITADNTLDWLTRIRVRDEYGTREALVHMNKPYDYRGYRFFQASFISEGKARQIALRATPEAGGQPVDVTIPRDGSATLPDGTRVDFKDFAANFSLGQGPSQMDPSVYNNPAATLAVTQPGGQPVRAFAFTPTMAEAAPFARQPVAGYTFRLTDFEKAPRAHVLSVQKDPGSTVVYVGFAMLGLTLCAVFFFSHDRVWAHVEERPEGGTEVVLGGNTNRNRLAFGDRFRRLAESTGGQITEATEVKKS
ncbi:MAG TPA: cytochrome c biogenesis protein ResB [Pyrinomonadaceae bacterium]|nr:cytochrome c biogenesis protein ResB [Pyrinomonadaceae bacterium]